MIKRILASFLTFDSLICAQIDKDLYLTDESRNLIVQMKKFEVPEVVNKQNIQKTKKERTTNNDESTQKEFNLSETVANIIIAPIAVVGFILLSPLIIWFIDSLGHCN